MRVFTFPSPEHNAFLFYFIFLFSESSADKKINCTEKRSPPSPASSFFLGPFLFHLLASFILRPGRYFLCNVRGINLHYRSPRRSAIRRAIKHSAIFTISSLIMAIVFFLSLYSELFVKFPEICTAHKFKRCPSRSLCTYLREKWEITNRYNDSSAKAKIVFYVMQIFQSLSKIISP